MQIKEYIKKTPLAYFFIKCKSMFFSPKPQNDEAFIINRLIRRYKVPKNFIEFGFSGWEFNCAELVDDWNGLLVDGDEYNIKIGMTIFGKNIKVERKWLTLDNLDIFRRWLGTRGLGILSIDVDGNDYWFLEKLIKLNPSIIIAEYNSSFGLRPITVEYDDNFDRRKKHSSWTYFGASITALNLLAESNNYGLIEVSNSGVNVFFVRKDLLTADDIVLQPEYVFREKIFNDGSRPNEQFEKIKNLKFVNVVKTSDCDQSASNRYEN